MFDARLVDDVEAAVQAAEKETSAELVVVLAPRSGSYRDADLLFGVVTAMAALALILYTPWPISTLVIIPDVLVGLVIGYALSWWVPGIRRLVTTAPRRAAQVRAAAKQAFFDQAVSATRGRTGILVYYSDLERSLSILADLPVQGKVPGHRFNEILDRFQRCGGDLPLVARLSRVIAEVKDAVKAEFPPSASNPNELPDRPRIEQV